MSRRGAAPSAPWSCSTSSTKTNCPGKPMASLSARGHDATPRWKSPRIFGSGTMASTRASPRPRSGNVGDSKDWTPTGISGGMAVRGESRCPRAISPCHSFCQKLLPVPTKLTSCRSPADITERLDRLIKEIRDKWHSPAMAERKQEGANGDVLIVAHGHILRAFAQRWAGQSLHGGPTFLLEAGGVGTLR